MKNETDNPIVLKNVSISFEGRSILKGIDLEVKKGETVVLFGPSGVGKTLILKLCMGLVQPDEGEIYLDGHNIAVMDEHELDEVRKSCGMLFQYYALFDSMTVYENIGFFLREHLNLKPSDLKARVDELLGLIDLPGIGDQKPAQLSGGMKKRVGIGRALAHEPKIVFYDSPTDGLDPRTADRINDMILDLGKRTQVTSLAISNDMATAYKIGTRIGMLFDGNILEIGTPEEIRNTQNPYVRQFIEGNEEGPIQYL